ncbi:MAG: phosphatidate cytidylyltransferase [Alphaproteobacteria bacterium]
MAPPAAEGRWSRLGRRILSAAVLAPPALAAVYVGTPYFDGLVALAVVILLWEVARTSGIARGETRTLWGWGALLYVVGAGLAALWLRSAPAIGRDIVFWIIAVTVATDCGAYAIGRAIGGPKLAPRLSPGKTWAGAVGGLAAGAVLGAVMPFATVLGGGIAAVGASLCLSAVAEAGDLVESAFKRRFGAKDMGRLLPGHGGLADRLDSVMAAMIAVALGRLVIEGGGLAW